MLHKPANLRIFGLERLTPPQRLQAAVNVDKSSRLLLEPRPVLGQYVAVPAGIRTH
jgi:hypothetical protein